MTHNESISYIKLCAIKDIGAITAMRLLKHFGSPQKIFEATKTELMQVEKIGAKTADAILQGKDLVDTSKILDAMNRIGARYIDFNSPDYPKNLQPLTDKPVGIYAIGDCDLSAPAISIVGSRNCTVYGQLMARRFASAFAQAGFTVISGMARGIDSMAHLGALEAGGKTIAVLGSGVDVVYPPENMDLYKKIIAQGAVISEFPMGSRADRQNFPIRNRIVAGMSVATVVVESDLKGGSMITARVAAEYGRDVFAIPGRIDSALSRGCNALIRDGAILASSPQDVIDALNFSKPVQMSLFDSQPNKTKICETQTSLPEETKKESCQLPKQNLSPDEATLFQIISREKTVHIDTLCELSKLEMKRCIPALLMLEIKRLICKDAGGNYSLKN